MQATPFVPKSDSEVVERLPSRLADAESRRAQRALRAQLQAAPQQLGLAVQLARESIQRARTLGDPREYGQAEAALAPWWALASPPPVVRLLRATIRQAQHEFSTALVDLDALLQPGADRSGIPLPLRAQAELTRASVLQVTGRWREAAAGCARLGGPLYAALGASVRTPAQACLAELDSLQGHAARGAQALELLAKEDAAQGGGEASWLALLRAELAERRGEPGAQALFRQALALQTAERPGTPPDLYTLAAYADWLLDHQRPRDAAQLLAGREDADALLLRLAIAWQDSHDPRATGAIATLTARFDAAAQRGDTSHGREQARYELDLMKRPAAALKHAQTNWASQREPGDALILARAAVAAGDATAAEPVWQLLRETGCEDARLRAVARAAGVTLTAAAQP